MLTGVLLALLSTGTATFTYTSMKASTHIHMHDCFMLMFSCIKSSTLHNLSYCTDPQHCCGSQRSSFLLLRYQPCILLSFTVHCAGSACFLHPRELGAIIHKQHVMRLPGIQEATSHSKNKCSLLLFWKVHDMLLVENHTMFFEQWYFGATFRIGNTIAAPPDAEFCVVFCRSNGADISSCGSE